MSLKVEMLSKALELPADDRAELARKLIISLDPPMPDNGVEEAWDSEIENRLTAMDRGESQLIDWRDSAQRARMSLQQAKPK